MLHFIIGGSTPSGSRENEVPPHETKMKKRMRTNKEKKKDAELKKYTNSNN